MGIYFVKYFTLRFMDSKSILTYFCNLFSQPDQEILHELERERLLVFSPSREIRGKRMVCYDDRYILKLAADNDGIVVSNDNYRDLIQECPEFRKVIEERILMYSFVNDR